MYSAQELHGRPRLLPMQKSRKLEPVDWDTFTLQLALPVLHPAIVLPIGSEGPQPQLEAGPQFDVQPLPCEAVAVTTCPIFAISGETTTEAQRELIPPGPA